MSINLKKCKWKYFSPTKEPKTIYLSLIIEEEKLDFPFIKHLKYFKNKELFLFFISFVYQNTDNSFFNDLILETEKEKIEKLFKHYM